MLARIIAPRGSLYYAGEATPYDLETLWQHLREFRPECDGDDVTLELTIDDGPRDSIVTSWVSAIAAAGFQVRVLHPLREEKAAESSAANV